MIIRVRLNGIGTKLGRWRGKLFGYLVKKNDSAFGKLRLFFQFCMHVSSVC